MAFLPNPPLGRDQKWKTFRVLWYIYRACTRVAWMQSELIVPHLRLVGKKVFQSSRGSGNCQHLQEYLCLGKGPSLLSLSPISGSLVSYFPAPTPPHYEHFNNIPIVYYSQNPNPTVLQAGKLRPPRDWAAKDVWVQHMEALNSLQECHPQSFLPEPLAWPIFILWTYLFLPDSDVPKVGKDLGKPLSLNPRKALLTAYWLLPSLSDGLSCPCIFAHRPTCPPPPSRQPNTRVTPGQWDTLASVQLSSTCPGHCCPWSTPLISDLPGGRWGSSRLSPAHSSCPVLLSLLHFPPLLMELTYKSWKPKPP